jgi:hypothetical protein
MKLDRLIDEARSSDTGWTREREGRVLGSTLRRHEARIARARFARRAIGLASATAIITFFFLRGTASSASPHLDAPAVVAADELANGDGGYGRD